MSPRVQLLAPKSCLQRLRFAEDIVGWRTAGEVEE